MKYALWFILLILCLDASLLYAAVDDPQPFPKELIDPSFLRQLTWRADKRIEQVVAGWPTYPDDQESQNWIVRRRTTIRILGSLFDAEYRTYKNNSETEIIVEAKGPDMVTDDCNPLLAWVKRALGQPKKVVDLTAEFEIIGGPTNTATVKDFKADWLFGDSRIWFACFAAVSKAEVTSIVISLHYAHRERLPALKDPIHLECTVKEKLLGKLADSKVREGAPVRSIADPNWKTLRWSNAVFGKAERFTDEHIVAVRELEVRNGKWVDRIEIDRVTGNYERTLLSPDGNRLEQWGKCTRVAPGKKF
jgi:hypothetical protein